jgi:hypothetical protein
VLTLRGTITQQYSVVPGVPVTLPRVAVSLPALDPSVAYISPARQLIGALDLTDAASNAAVA